MSEDPNDLLYQFDQQAYRELLNCAWATAITEFVIQMKVLRRIRIKDEKKREEFEDLIRACLHLSIHRIDHFSKSPSMSEVCDTAKRFLDAAEIKYQPEEITAAYLCIETEVKKVAASPLNLKHRKHEVGH